MTAVWMQRKWLCRVCGLVFYTLPPYRGGVATHCGQWAEEQPVYAEADPAAARAKKLGPR